jgi:hypothetical protein
MPLWKKRHLAGGLLPGENLEEVYPDDPENLSPTSALARRNAAINEKLPSCTETRALTEGTGGDAPPLDEVTVPAAGSTGETTEETRGDILAEGACGTSAAATTSATENSDVGANTATTTSSLTTKSTTPGEKEGDEKEDTLMSEELDNKLGGNKSGTAMEVDEPVFGVEE